jgi:Short C-terminal domain
VFGKKKNVLMHGVPAQATVTGVEDTGVYVNGSPRVKVTLQVQPEGIGAPFQATKKVTANRLSLPVVGSQLWVKYDPDDTSKVEFDQAKNDEMSASVRASPAAPATPAANQGAPTTASFTTAMPVGQTVIDARNLPGLRAELLKAVADMQSGGNPHELQEAIAKAMSQGHAMNVPPGMMIPGAMGVSPGTGALPQPAAPDPLDQLEKLNELRKSGALTQAEFDAQKARILGET